jgi:hypothetical protein
MGLDALEPHALAQALALVPREVAAKNNLFPMGADTSTLTVAMSDPANVAIVDELQFRTGRRVRVCVGGDREIADAIRRYYSGGGSAEAIAIELGPEDVGGVGAFVEDPIGGGSHQALEAFFGQAPEPPPAATAALRGAPAAARDPNPTPRPPPAAPRAPAAARDPAPTPRPPLAAPRAPQRPAQARAAAVRGAAFELDLEERTGARAQLLGAVPGAGFAEESLAQGTPPQQEPEELTPLPLPAGEPILATELAPPPAGAAAPTEPGQELDPREAALLDALFRLGRGDDAGPSVFKPEQVVAALLRILLDKGIVTEEELVDQLLGR